MTEETDNLVNRLLRHGNPKDIGEAAVVIKTQAERIKELEAENSKLVLRALALISLLPDSTTCGDIQSALTKLEQKP